jgi:regulatory protein
VFEKKQTDKITNPEIALIKMQSWCAYQERCQQEARDKLYGFGLWPDAVENIISSLIESNFLNEERFAMQFVHGKHVIKKWGRIKIKIELKQKRVSDYCIKKAMAQIDDTEYMTTLRKLIETKQRLTNEKNPIKLKLKVLNYALSKGYERDLVFDVLND